MVFDEALLVGRRGSGYGCVAMGLRGRKYQEKQQVATSSPSFTILIALSRSKNQ
jgi:hypothetical protein